MTPRTLADWTVEAVLEIVTKGLFETEDFDLKEMLPRASDENGKRRLRSSCCAFANSNGGFLIFGVADDRTLRPEERLRGLESSLDFPEHFGAYPQSCTPGIEWTFLNPPLLLPSGRVIHVVHIPKSWKAPHAVGNAEEGWRFMKRTNKGNEGMSMEEIRAGFLNYYERRLRLQLLKAELERLKQAAYESRIGVDGGGTEYSLVTFDVGVIESILTETYSITASSPQLLKALSELRHEVRIANNKLAIFFGAVEHLGSGEFRTRLIRPHNEFMAAKCRSIESFAQLALDALGELLGSP